MNSLFIFLISLIFIYTLVVATPPPLSSIKINITVDTFKYEDIPSIKNSISHKFLKTEDEEYQIAYKKCNDSSIEYDACFPMISPEMKDIDELCSKSNTNKCKEYATKGLNIIPECQVDVLQDFVKMYNELISFISFNFNLNCATDESGNYCPLTKQIINEMKDKFNNIDSQAMEVKEQQYYQNVEKTCESPKCVNAFVSYYQNREKEYEKFYEAVLRNPDNPYSIQGDMPTGNIPEFKSGFNGNFNSSITINNVNHSNKRSFSIENYKNNDYNNYINSTIDYFNSEECNKIFQKKKEKKDNSGTIHYYSYIHNIILITITILFITLI